MFIAWQPIQRPSSGGARCSLQMSESNDNIGLLQSWRNILEPASYKYCVPTGLIVWSQILKEVSIFLREHGAELKQLSVRVLRSPSELYLRWIQRISLK